MLDRIHKLNEEEKEVLKSSEWQLKKLSVRGRISTFFQKKPKSEKKAHKELAKKKDKADVDKKKVNLATEQPAVEEELTEEDGIWHPEKKKTSRGVQQPAESSENSYLEGMTPAQREMIEDQDRDLDMMSSILGDLKQISIQTNTELNSQSEKIEQIHVQVDQNNYALQKTNIRLQERLR